MIEWLQKWLTLPARHREALRKLETAHRMNAQLLAQAKEEAVLRKRLRAREAELAQIKASIEASYTLPGLSPGEIERLAILAEECGEVAQAVGKVLRFGWESQSPYGGKPNRVALEREIGNVRAIVNLMLDADDLRLNEVQTWQRSKRVALHKWTLYQECSMPREEQLEMMNAIGKAAAD